MKPFYVWKDNLLEELFAMEKEDMDTNYSILKQQLEKEKVVFIEIMAEGMKDACNKYRDLQDEQREAIEIDLEQSEETSSDHIIKTLQKIKKTLH